MQVEATLYSFETSYLAPPPDNPNGPTYGNIVRGYDSYLKAPNATLGLSERKRVKGNAYALEVRPEERLFSTSSETYQRVRSSLVAAICSEGRDRPWTCARSIRP
jgi:chromatin modification-related protein EAF6